MVTARRSGGKLDRRAVGGTGSSVVVGDGAGRHRSANRSCNGPATANATSRPPPGCGPAHGHREGHRGLARRAGSGSRRTGRSPSRRSRSAHRGGAEHHRLGQRPGHGDLESHRAGALPLTTDVSATRSDALAAEPGHLRVVVAGPAGAVAVKSAGQSALMCAARICTRSSSSAVVDEQVVERLRLALEAVRVRAAGTSATRSSHRLCSPASVQRPELVRRGVGSPRGERVVRPREDVQVAAVHHPGVRVGRLDRADDRGVVRGLLAAAARRGRPACDE